jgi:ribosomal protein S21
MEIYSNSIFGSNFGSKCRIIREAANRGKYEKDIKQRRKKNKQAAKSRRRNRG